MIVGIFRLWNAIHSWILSKLVRRHNRRGLGGVVSLSELSDYHRLPIQPSHNVFGTSTSLSVTARRLPYKTYFTKHASPSDSCANVDPGDAPQQRPLLKWVRVCIASNALQVMLPLLIFSTLMDNTVRSKAIFLKTIFLNPLFKAVLFHFVVSTWWQGAKERKI